ncbi:DUF3048 domain-containing protein [Candidatus Saccharibacteria bacterium]|nr:DUF3048 domain-containing protein [Candidatus Saccharibacteria bacterium]
MENKNDFNNFKPTQTTDVTKTKRFNFSSEGFKNFFKKRPSRKHLGILLGIGLVLIGAGIAYFQFFAPEPAEPNPVPELTSNYVPPAPTTLASPLTGVQVEPALAQRAVTGIMIENSVDARPQAGLVDAGVVFEAIAEGGITRFLALFQEAQPDYIGPIRSARPYYVRWAAGFDAGYTHSGGSGEALALIQSLGVKDMDHGTYGNKYFDRVSNRYAPHNVYTSMARLDELRNSKGYTTSTFVPFSRIAVVDEKDKVATETPPVLAPANTIAFNISSPLYNTSYTYDAAANVYKRTMAGQPHNDEKSGKQISPTVVIALVMSYGIHADGVHSTYANVGSGKVLIFQNGVVQEGTWTKASDKAELAFKDAAGLDIALQPGQTWITAIPDGRTTYSP